MNNFLYTRIVNVLSWSVTMVRNKRLLCIPRCINSYTLRMKVPATCPCPEPIPVDQSLEYYPLSAVCACLFNIFAATHHIGGHTSIRNLRTCHAVLTGTHLSWLYCIIWCVCYNKWFIRCIVSMYNQHYCFLSSWHISFLGSSGKVAYQASHLQLQILCLNSITIVCRVKRYV